MKHLKSLICLLLALLLLSGCAPAAPAQSDASTEPVQTEEAAPAEQTEQAGPEAPAEKETTEPEADFITVTDHNDNVVQVPKNAQRIAVCDILPLPSVLCVFFDSAEKLVGIAPSMRNFTCASGARRITSLTEWASAPYSAFNLAN